LSAHYSFLFGEIGLVGLGLLLLKEGLLLGRGGFILIDASFVRFV
jgi:hypothetical protein